MKVLALVLALAFTSSEAKPQFTCEECISEMHNLGWYVKAYAPAITSYLVEEFCPTTQDEDCANHVGEHYVEMIVSNSSLESLTSCFSPVCYHQPLCGGRCHPHLPADDDLWGEEQRGDEPEPSLHLRGVQSRSGLCVRVSYGNGNSRVHFNFKVSS